MKITIEISDNVSDTISKTISINQVPQPSMEGAFSEQPANAGAPAISSGLFASLTQNSSEEHAKDGGGAVISNHLVNSSMDSGFIEEINQGVAPFPSQPLSGSSNISNDSNLVDIGGPSPSLLSSVENGKNDPDTK